MRLKSLFFLALLLAGQPAFGQPRLEPRASDPAFAKFSPLKAPQNHGLFLKKRDRLAIIGDSITEQKMYSRIIEDYLTVCVPELEISVRQYGWSGEQASGFLARMTNDCLRFQPTVATTCYGMNDHRYRPFETTIGEVYRANSLRIIEAFKVNKVRVVQGSPGCVGKMPGWVKEASGTVEDLNLSLCTLRNIGIELAQKENVRFADVFWPMYLAGVEAQRRFDTNYAIAGKDGVHPDWAGHAVMAHSFLKALGVNGAIGTLIVNLENHRMRTSAGHELVNSGGGSFTIRSTRYPFCPCLESGQGTAGYPECDKDNPASESSIRSVFGLIPFNQDLNRFMLLGKKGKAQSYTVSWGADRKTFSSTQLAQGINLAAEFPCNPFQSAFAAVDAAVAAKQAYETKQIKQLFRSGAAKANMGEVVAQSEREREALVQAVRTAFVPVNHTITVTPN